VKHICVVGMILVHYVYYSYNTGRPKQNLLRVKIKGDSYSFDIDESEYGNQIALSSTKFKLEII
jgi:hypothetical protein